MPGRRRIVYPAGESYEIPYRCMVPQSVDALLVAGRCISTTHEALASTRLTPTVMTLGQAAGVAAAICIERATPAARRAFCRTADASGSGGRRSAATAHRNDDRALVNVEIVPLPTWDGGLLAAEYDAAAGLCARQ